MSSFRRATKGGAVPRCPGTKSWINGQTLVSSGLKEVDNIIGGGFNLGTVVLIEEDRHSSHAKTLASYFLAEGVSGKHHSLVVGDDLVHPSSSLIESLPFNLTVGTIGGKEQSAGTVEPLESSRDGDPLKVAWQYRKYMPDPKGPSSGPPKSSTAGRVPSYCHSYDLGRPIQPELLDDASIQTASLYGDNDCDNGTFPTQRAFEIVSDFIDSKLGPQSSGSSAPVTAAARIVISPLLSPIRGFRPDDSAAALPQLLRFLHALRGKVRSSSAVVMVCLPPHLLSSQALRRVEHMCDVVLRLESFAGRDMTGHEFEDFAGFFHVRKLPRLNSPACYVPDTLRFGFKRNRRKLVVEKLHLPPEHSRSGSSSAPTSTQPQQPSRTALEPGMACGSGGAKKGPSLDF